MWIIDEVITFHNNGSTEHYMSGMFSSREYAERSLEGAGYELIVDETTDEIGEYYTKKNEYCTINATIRYMDVGGDDNA